MKARSLARVSQQDMSNLSPTHDILNLRLIRAESIESVKQSASGGNTHFAIHSKIPDSYVRLDENYFDCFTLMDGNRTISQIRDTVFADSKRPNVKTLSQFVALLYQNQLAITGSDHDNRMLSGLIGEREEVRHSRLVRLGSFILKFKIGWNNADKLVSVLYAKGGKYLFSPTAFVLYASVVLGGSVFLGLHLRGIFTNLMAVQSHGLVGVMMAVTGLGVASVIHESAHALTTKHFGRRVSSLGFVLYYCAPGFYTDTTDTWMLPKRKRIAVVAAGGVANVVAAAALILIASAFSTQSVNQLCIVWGFLNLAPVFVNMIPFLKYDGYFALADVLDRPSLREDALTSVFSRGAWNCLLSSRQRSAGLAFTMIFGLCSILFGLLTLCSALGVTWSIVYQHTSVRIRLPIALALELSIIVSVARSAYHKIRMIRQVRAPAN
jgi:Zn-dependent protease